jgi:ribosome-associated heat shock protein Hsp15
MADGSLRIDKFLWFARLAKTRSIAQTIACEGHLRIDGRRIDRAHVPVRCGDVLSFPLHGHVRIIRIEALPARRGPAEKAQACYTDLSPGKPNVVLPNSDDVDGGGAPT